jgi:hypothetical protein
LKKDLISLYKIILKVSKVFFELFGIQITKNLTISGMSVKIFFKLCDNKCNLPLINDDTIYTDIHNAYYGGRVEVFNPIVDTTAYYYDVNSLYPYASLKPLPGLNCEFIENITGKLVLNDLFGFFYCKVKCNTKNYLGLLPFKTDKGLLFPVGQWYA